jgi:hypothetical protein
LFTESRYLLPFHPITAKKVAFMQKVKVSHGRTGESYPAFVIQGRCKAGENIMAWYYVNGNKKAMKKQRRSED